MTPIIIQARMSSNRLPGKILKTIGDKSVLGHVVARCREVDPNLKLVLATSVESSDDPIVDFAVRYGVDLYRGPLEDVYLRYTKIIEKIGCDQFVRICADSPFISPALIKYGLKISSNFSFDIVTNAFPRSFPKGQTVEIINSSSFINAEYKLSKNFSEEHITQGFYSNKAKYRIINFSAQPEFSNKLASHALDTAEDYENLVKFWIDHNQYPSVSMPNNIKLY